MSLSGSKTNPIGRCTIKMFTGIAEYCQRSFSSEGFYTLSSLAHQSLPGARSSKRVCCFFCASKEIFHLIFQSIFTANPWYTGYQAIRKPVNRRSCSLRSEWHLNPVALVPTSKPWARLLHSQLVKLLPAGSFPLNYFVSNVRMLAPTSTLCCGH